MSSRGQTKQQSCHLEARATPNALAFGLFTVDSTSSSVPFLSEKRKKERKKEKSFAHSIDRLHIIPLSLFSGPPDQCP